MNALPRSCLRSITTTSRQTLFATARPRFPAFFPPSQRNPIQIPCRNVSQQPADRDDFVSILDKPPVMIRAGRKRHGPGLILLVAMPVIAFGLGCWQVYRLEWKTELIARFEDRLCRPALPLPPVIDTTHLEEFDYRRVWTTGRFRHDQEMLVGPRIREGENGFSVVTPLERKDGSTVLVNRGWINKKMMNKEKRKTTGALPEGEVTVEGLIRDKSTWKKNSFTPVNRPDINEFYFPDVEEMATLVGAQPVWIEETMEPDLAVAMDFEEKGKPIGRPAEVNIRNNHLQYICTWYGLSVATSIMLWMLLRKPPAQAMKQVRHTRDWR